MPSHNATRYSLMIQRDSDPLHRRHPDGPRFHCAIKGPRLSLSRRLPQGPASRAPSAAWGRRPPHGQLRRWFAEPIVIGSTGKACLVHTAGTVGCRNLRNLYFLRCLPQSNPTDQALKQRASSGRCDGQSRRHNCQQLSKTLPAKALEADAELRERLHRTLQKLLVVFPCAGLREISVAGRAQRCEGKSRARGFRLQRHRCAASAAAEGQPPFLLAGSRSRDK